MGTVTIPNTGLIYIDTSIVIYSVETHAVFLAVVKTTLGESTRRRAFAREQRFNGFGVFGSAA